MSYGILIIDDEVSLAKNMQTYLKRFGHEVQCAANGGDGLKLFESFAPDVVLLDLKLPDIDGLEVLPRLRGIDPDVKVVLITAHGNVQVAVDAMKAGAWDYLSKPVILSDLKRLIDKASGEDSLKGALAYYTERQPGKEGLGAIVGASPAIAALKSRIEQLLKVERAAVDGDLAPVLVIGETGSGKELVARALHFEGSRRRGPFIELNCAALPAQLLEDELFGHERGAFTDAKERKIGLVEAAHGGTLFLDEIGDMDIAIQAKLLKLLETKKVRRLGGVRERQFDVRFIAATNKPLEDLVESGAFRADLYYRLRIVQLETPPLRARDDDVVSLAKWFLKRHGQRYGRPDMTLSADAIKALRAHCWPGNVRELANVIEQAVLMSTVDRIGADALALSSLAERARRDANDNGRFRFALPSDGIDLEQLEQQAVEQALDRVDWNVTAAARLLNLSRDTLRYRIEKYGLSRPD
ncbi:MAG: sigma-54 dependent transcriptional regulator [Alphaproteobacteria bacterium]|nr:sigma-54 dependent transcriptional regulator [Alphaproteobacteria bacterium]